MTNYENAIKGNNMSETTNSQRVAEMARKGLKLPKGTRIVSTMGGVPTGGTHEIKDHVLRSANEVSRAFDDPRPFWCYGWDDLHAGLILPANKQHEARR